MLRCIVYLSIQFNKLLQKIVECGFATQADQLLRSCTAYLNKQKSENDQQSTKAIALRA